MDQLHKRFTDQQVKDMLQRHLTREIERPYLQTILGIGKAHFFTLVQRYRAWGARRRYMAAQGAKLSNPQNAEARYGLAHLYAQARRWRRAQSYANEAVDVATDNPLYTGVPYAYYRVLGLSLYGLRRYAEAADVFERALKARSETDHLDALLGLAKANYRLGRYEQALDFARHAVAEQESALEGYFRWAQCAAKLRNAPETAEARRRFRAVAATLPWFARQRRLGWRFAFLLFPISRRIG